MIKNNTSRLLALPNSYKKILKKENRLVGEFQSEFSSRKKFDPSSMQEAVIIMSQVLKGSMV